uniref:Uncharacterized protein n=1 Tax=Arundo donax TaxID=35708 RepID=A0A0A8ZAW0_ARUDO
MIQRGNCQTYTTKFKSSYMQPSLSQSQLLTLYPHKPSHTFVNNY